MERKKKEVKNQRKKKRKSDKIRGHEDSLRWKRRRKNMYICTYKKEKQISFIKINTPGYNHTENDCVNHKFTDKTIG